MDDLNGLLNGESAGFDGFKNEGQSVIKIDREFTDRPEKSGITTSQRKNGCWMGQRLCTGVLQN